MKKITMILSCLFCFGVAFAGGQSSPVNINSATIQQLETLKGVGPKKAQSIIDQRKKIGKFKSLDELTKIKGINETVLARIQKNNPERILLTDTKKE